MRIRSATIFLVLCSAGGARAQFSLYASGSYGFNTDPLYNYASVPDHVSEGYLEMGYLRASRENDVRLGYVGGLMNFQGLTERSYYEHRADLGYAARFGRYSRPAVADSDEDDEAREIFRGKRLELAARLSSRYDTQTYDQFDNQGADVSGAFTWGVGAPASFSLTDQAGARRYQYLPELNNVTDLLTADAAVRPADSLRVDWSIAAGVKRFTTGQVDTARVIIGGGPSFTPGNRGKGKGGAGLQGNNGASQGKQTKVVLENSGTTNTYQLTTGMGAADHWSGGRCEAQLLYRYNPGTNVRFLVQYANSTILTQDIYNDFFSYGGPELNVVLRQGLPLKLQLAVDAKGARRRYLAPALDLAAVETASNRIDVRGTLEVALTRSFPIDDAWSFDVTLDAVAIRNQSNDAYNDYALTSYALSIGIGL